MKFILINETIQQNCINHLLNVPLDGKTECVFQDVDTTRSGAQNRLMWGAWYPVICEYTGYTKDELHELVKAKFFGVKEMVTKDRNGKKIVLHVPNGSTASLPVYKKEEDKPCMTKFLEFIELLAHELGLNLPYPDDYKFAMTGKR